MSSSGAIERRPEPEPATDHRRARSGDRRASADSGVWRHGLGLPVWFVLGGLLLAGGAICLVQTRATTLSFDEWEWALGRRGFSAATFLRPHNGHFSLLPLIIYKLLFVTVGIRHYLLYRLAVTAAHLACVTLVFVYTRRRLGDLPALLAAAWIVFLGPAWQNFLWPFQLAWLLSIGAGLGALLALERGERRGDVVASVLLAASLASSGVGMAVAAGICVEVLARRRWRELWIIVAPLALFALWWLAYQNSSTTAAALRHAPLYVAREAAATFAGLAGLSGDTIPFGSGTLLTYGPALALTAAALLAWTLARRRRASVRVFALLATIGAFWVLTGLGRAGVATPYSSRYLYVGGVFLVVLGVELLRGVALRLVPAGVGALLIVAAIISNLGVFGQAGGFERAIGQTTVADLGALDIARAVVSPRYVPTRFPGLGLTFTVGAYEAMKRAIGTPAATPSQLQALPEGPRETADLELLSMHRVALGAVPAHLSLGAAPAARTVAGAVVRTRGACLLVTPRAPGGAVELTLPGAGILVRAAAKPVTVLARRFAGTPALVGTVTDSTGRVLRIGRDASSIAWTVRLQSAEAFSACGLVASAAAPS